MSGREWLVPQEVAEELRVSLRTVRRMPLPWVALSPRRRILFRRDLVAYLERCRRRPA